MLCLGKIWLNKATFVKMRMSVAHSQKKCLMGSKMEDLAEGFEVVGSFSSFPRVNGLK